MTRRVVTDTFLKSFLVVAPWVLYLVAIGALSFEKKTSSQSQIFTSSVFILGKDMESVDMLEQS